MKKLLAFCLMVCCAVAQAQLVTYPEGLKTGMPHNDDYTVRVRVPGGEWKDLFEYNVQVDMDRVQDASMVQFDMGSPVEVMVKKNNGTIHEVDIRPQVNDIRYVQYKNVITFMLDKPRYLSVEFNGDRLHNLHVFANPMETETYSKEEKGVMYFGPGVHRPKDLPNNQIRIPSNTTVYLAPGAVVKAKLWVDKAENVRIVGRGILDHPIRGIEITDSKNLLAELNYKRFMYKKLCILLIFSKLKVAKLLIDKYRMHNLYAIFAKLLNICKHIAGNLVNESGNVPRRGVVPKFSDLEVVALNMASEAVGIDSESLLFAKLQEYRVEIPNLISRRQYNDRRKITSSLCNAIRERMVSEMDGGEGYFCIDSKPIEVCRIARSKRCSMGKKDFKKAPSVGYCASQSMYYYGYKLHAVCGLSGVIHSFDLTKASVHDIHYLKDVKVDYSNCTVIGDRGYISAQVQLDLFETANIRLEVPYRCNQKEWKPTFPAFAKARKRIETLFSQLCDQFMIIRNYAKDTDGLFARIIGKISALTILQYINYKNEKPIGRVKYALF